MTLEEMKEAFDKAERHEEQGKWLGWFGFVSLVFSVATFGYALVAGAYLMEPVPALASGFLCLTLRLAAEQQLRASADQYQKATEIYETISAEEEKE